jgi:hypothetical protein
MISYQGEGNGVIVWPKSAMLSESRPEPHPHQSWADDGEHNDGYVNHVGIAWPRLVFLDRHSVWKMKITEIVWSKARTRLQEYF